MLNAIIIDDEKSSLQSLKLDLEEYCPEVKVVASCQSAALGIQAIAQYQPDLVFLDIEMPRMNGFELLQSLSEITFDVIFVTAYDQFAVRAFQFNAIDYILKPILRSQLIQAVQKVLDRKQHKFSQPKLDALINNVQLQSHQTIENIALPSSEGYEFVPVKYTIDDYGSVDWQIVDGPETSHMRIFRINDYYLYNEAMFQFLKDQI